MAPNVICAKLSRTRGPSQLRAEKAYTRIVTEYRAENWRREKHGVDGLIRRTHSEIDN